MSLALESSSHASNSKGGFDMISLSSANHLMKLSEFKVSSIHENNLTKAKCGLCKAYYRRETVNYTVPNHRIMELKKTWNKSGKVIFEGRRYHHPSYMYTTTIVCLFCSQFFWILPDEKPTDQPLDEMAILKPKEVGPKLEIQTEVERENIAINQKTYQSSEVDNKYASLAITPPYEVFARTKREVDPWWEIDLGKRYHIESLSFNILVGNRQNFSVYVMLLDKAIGFENPFLEEVKKQALYVKEIPMEQQDKARKEHIEFKIMPQKVHAHAIRIQLKGIQILTIDKFILLQGDDLIYPSEQDMQMVANSFASLPPEKIKAELKAMMSPAERKAIMLLSAPPEIPSRDEVHHMNNSQVQNLSKTIHKQYQMITEWKDRVLTSAKFFPHDVITSLYKVLFKYVAEMNPMNKETAISEYELLSNGLTQHYPRLNLHELHHRLRSVLQWIQTRSHAKQLGALMSYPELNVIADNSHESLFHLMSAFKRVDYYFNKKEEKDRAEYLRFQEKLRQSSTSRGGHSRHGSPSRRGARSPSPMREYESKVADQRGCSWGQFLIIMHMLVTQQSLLIPKMAFNIENQRAAFPHGAMEELDSIYSYHTGDGHSVSSYGNSVFSPLKPTSYAITRKFPNAKNGPNNGNNLSSKSNDVDDDDDDADDDSQCDNPTTNEGKPSSSSLQDRPSSSVSISGMKRDLSLQQVVRKNGFVPYDSAFAEYKFSNFKKKQQTYIEFPPDLSLDFAKSLNPRRVGIVLTNRRPDTGDSAQGDNFNSNGVILDPLNRTNQSGNYAQDSQSVASKDVSTSSRNGKMHTSASLPVLSKAVSFDAAAAEKNRHGSLSLSYSNLKDMFNGANVGTPSAPTPINRQTSTKSAIPNTPMTASSKTTFSATDLYGDDDDYNFDDDEDDNGSGKKKKAIKHIDFFRVCALCELRLPRNSIDFKVIRKHVVKLRSSWDPTLVSKEVRSLDNSISMYNLVYVCVFCAQFFDPDFNDGIAYPVRILGKKTFDNKISEALQIDQDPAKSLKRFYDVRYIPDAKLTGEVFRRPETSESRHRAKRATEIAHLLKRPPTTENSSN